MPMVRVSNGGSNYRVTIVVQLYQANSGGPIYTNATYVYDIIDGVATYVSGGPASRGASSYSASASIVSITITEL